MYVCVKGGLCVAHLVCTHTAHKVCGAGEWIVAAGTATSDRKCRSCPEGRFRAKAPTKNKVEDPEAVCIGHQTCKAGHWTEVVGSAVKDTVCSACSSGRFRSEAATRSEPEEESSVCLAHKTCAAGEWTEVVGTATKNTVCTGCPFGTARPEAPTNRTAVEAASSCEPCSGKSVYSDEVGLAQCKTCPSGHFGVIAAGSDAEGGHKACDDDTCERPTNLPANAVVVGSECPEHGKQVLKTAFGVTTRKASTCALSCEDGFYSSDVNTPFTCLADGESTTASFQGGNITCTGECVGVRCFVCAALSRVV